MSRKTFIEESIIHGKTHIIYGNVLDEFCTPDLSLRDFDEYLVKLLKSRGFKNIIFYGSAGNKGEYVVDYESARYFYSNENNSIPLPDFDTEEDSDGDGGGEALSGEASEGARNSAMGTVTGMMNKRKRRSFPTAEGEAPQQQEQVEADKVRYSSRAMSLPEFIKRAKVWMENSDPKKRTAIVFYNMLTTDFHQEPSLIDLITGAWENHNTAENVCIFVAPTENGIEGIINSVRNARLDGFFLEKSVNDSTLSKERSTYIGAPDQDELKNLLRRLMIVGTKKKHIRAKVEYSDLEKLALHIMAVSRKNSKCEKLRSIRTRLENFIEANPKEKITEQIIDDMWRVEHMDKSRALEKMNREGWETPYRFFSEFSERDSKLEERRAKSAEDKAESREDADWAIDRISVVKSGAEDRKTIPHFVLLGPPGVGKSTFVQLIGDWLHEHNYIKTNNVIKVGKQDLTSSFIAGIPQATRECIERANEGVLFIDEAHLLGEEDGGVNHSPTGKEVVSTLNYYMQDNCRCSVILAGYEDKMDKLFDMDPGFKGRFSGNIIRMKAYEPELLYKILLNSIKEQGFSIDEGLIKAVTQEGIEYNPLLSMVEKIYSQRDREKFRNAFVMVSHAKYACGRSENGVVTRECFYGYDFNDNGRHRVDESYFVPLKVFDSYEKIMNDMDAEIVGMDNVKEKMNNIRLILENKRLEAEKGIAGSEKNLKAIILAGNPGTGKDTIVKFLARAYYTFGLLGTDEVIERSASYFASEHGGGAQTKMQEVIKQAQNKKALLFINEAHELCNKSFDGAGALKTLTAPMTDKEKPIMVVFAVYPDKVDELLKLEKGLRRRTQVIKLEDYTPDELMQIVRLNLSKDKLALSDEAQNVLEAVLERVYDTRTSETGNAGYVIDELIPDIETNRLRRCEENGISSVSEEGRIIVTEDIPYELRANVDVRNAAQRVQALEALKREIKEDIIGYDAIKTTLCEKIDMLIQNFMYPKNKQTVEPGHYFFKGDPGTGKTTGAKLLAKYLYKINLITSEDIIKGSATDLIAGYLGQTGIKTQEKLEAARGKVILIDEAYSLANDDSHGGIDSYKKDAISKVVDMLDDEAYRKTTCVIFSGYGNDMDKLYAVNDGFKSRVTEIEFERFELETCVNVLKSIAEANHFPLNSQAINRVYNVIAQMREDREFSNGRTLRKFYEYLAFKAGERRLREKYSQDDERAYFILPEDIPEDYRQAKKFTNLG